MIPEEFRPAAIAQPLRSGLRNMMTAWDNDEFVLDPSRITLSIGRTGYDGDTFKREQLMDRHGVQINKTSRNTVLFMTNIGTTRSSVAFLVEVLVKIARELDDTDLRDGPRRARPLRAAGAPADRTDVGVAARLQRVPRRLPRPQPGHERHPGGRRPRARSTCPTTTPSASTSPTIRSTKSSTPASMWCRPRSSRRTRRASRCWFPGRCSAAQILSFIRSLDTPEIHGYSPDFGYRVYTDKAIEMSRQSNGHATNGHRTLTAGPPEPASAQA